MTRRAKLGAVVMALLVTGVLGLFMVRFPGAWARVIFPLPERGAQESGWDYWERANQQDPLPCFFGRYAESSEDRIGRIFTRRLHDLEVSRAEFAFSKKNQPSTEESITPLPPYGFGAQSSIPEGHPSLAMLKKPCELMKNADWFKKLNSEEQAHRLKICNFWDIETECRAIVHRNPAPLPMKEKATDVGDHPVASIRAVCPYAGIEFKWAVYELPLNYDYESGEIIAGAGLWSEACITADPLHLLNQPPPWVDTCLPRDCLQFQKSALSRDDLPPWPIYVEDQGKLRKATKADLPFLKNGTFKVTN